MAAATGWRPAVNSNQNEPTRMHMKRGNGACRIRRCLAWACTALALGAAAPAPADDTLVIPQANGKIAVVPLEPARTMSLDLASIDTLDVLGVEVQGVPILARWSGPLARYAGDRYLKIGSLFTPNPEVIAAAAPQVILVGARSSAAAAALARLAPTADMSVDRRSLLESVVRNAGILGKLYGKEEEADRRVQALRESIDALRAKAGGAGRAMVILATGGKMVVHGPGMRFGLVHDLLGMPSAVQDFSQANEYGLVVTAEDIARIDPEWIVVIDRDKAIGRTGTVPARQLLDQAAVHGTRAWRGGRVVMLDEFDWYLVGNAGLGALQRTVDHLDRILPASR